MTNKIVPLSQLRIGQRFSWIPKAWYGPCRLTVKTLRREAKIEWRGGLMQIRRVVEYDIKFDAAVVNPPGVEYGVLATTKVRLLSQKKAKAESKKSSRHQPNSAS